MSTRGNVPATYQGSGNPALVGYYPAWVDNMADDALLECSLSARCMTARSIGSPALTMTKGSSRTTSLKSGASPSAVSS